MHTLEELVTHLPPDLYQRPARCESCEICIPQQHCNTKLQSGGA